MGDPVGGATGTGADAPIHAAARASSVAGGDLDRLTLRFANERLEAAFRTELWANVRASVRVAHLLGIGAWVAWWLIVSQYVPATPGVTLAPWPLVLIPILVAGLIVTVMPFAKRIWEAEVVIVNVLAALVWTLLVTEIADLPFDLGYVGAIFVMAFAFTLNRLRFVPMTIAGIGVIVAYFGVVITAGDAEARQMALAFLVLVSFLVLGVIASYTLERFTRLLFLRERQLDHERARSQALLLNVLPEAIAERLMARSEAGTDQETVERTALADGYPEVAVLFADLAGFTEQAGTTTPDALVATLDELFSQMDTLADRYGLEKIKTIGDAYLAAAGVPTQVGDPAARAMEMALDLVEAIEGRRWPSGDPVQVRVGIAAGPVVAGVIGRRKFAFDIWGDAVNLASRLQAAGRPGSILVADSAAERAADRFVFGPVEWIDLKGKGSQAVRTLEGRATVPASRGAPS
jgi:class 3 adenylate cyclase